MAESLLARKIKARTAKKKVDEKSCVTPAGTSNELDVQHEWEEKHKKTTLNVSSSFLFILCTAQAV